MKNALNLFLVLIMCFFTLGCSKDVAANTNTVLENAQSAQKKQECFETDCRDCPDIEPYIEEHNRFWGSNSQMIYWADKTKESLYKRYDILCKDIISSFKEDEVFIKAFKNDVEAFKNYRDTQNKLSFPDENRYGLMAEYSKWGSDYVLTVQHIEELKNKISTYCFHNSAFLKNVNVCSDENIDKIFDKVKLKEPKPVISTPYDK